MCWDKVRESIVSIPVVSNATWDGELEGGMSRNNSGHRQARVKKRRASWTCSVFDEKDDEDRG